MGKAYLGNMSNQPMISIAGTVGVGKSTLTRKLSEVMGLQAMYEDVESNPYLDLYYKDLKEWSFHFQVHFLAQKLMMQRTILENGSGIIQDRSIFEDVSIFVKMQYENGNMTLEEYKTYSLLAENIIKSQFFPKPDLLIYIDGKFEDIMKRVIKRGRVSESSIPLSYWEELYYRYNKWINEFTLCPILKICIDDYDCEDDESILNVIDKIKVDFPLKI
ncbi:deoxynucleoside kinase [Bacillus thuringiensis]|uniref:deoxynucleoside kinase n=1 Tax=Bacillus thuringiensis TaxID=1428 RepID=UPI000BF9C91A|nr:deoxynucleoside kinase [Bacillus thuringiensis]PEY73219.1 deoxynucleoside kinase [Bacillus thuringiensis]